MVRRAFLLLVLFPLLLSQYACVQREAPPPTLAQRAAALKGACNAACGNATSISISLPPHGLLYATQDAICVRTDDGRALLSCGTCSCGGYGLSAGELARSDDRERNVTCAFSSDGDSLRVTCA